MVVYVYEYEQLCMYMYMYVNMETQLYNTVGVQIIERTCGVIGADDIAIYINVLLRHHLF